MSESEQAMSAEVSQSEQSALPAVAAVVADARPFLVVTVLMDAAARPAALTRSHGDALARAIEAAAGEKIAGIDIVELPILAKTFDALRGALHIGEDTVGLYDVFPLASHLDAATRQIAGQFLAAEAVWALDEQGALGGVPVHLTLNLPKHWDKDPKRVHAKLVEAGALELSPEGVEAFRRVKAKWDAAVAVS